jgi:hypothetical protein
MRRHPRSSPTPHRRAAGSGDVFSSLQSSGGGLGKWHTAQWKDASRELRDEVTTSERMIDLDYVTEPNRFDEMTNRSRKSAKLILTKLAAAERLLNAAIRMTLANEDILAVHTVAHAAYRILRDIKKHDLHHH